MAILIDSSIQVNHESHGVTSAHSYFHLRIGDDFVFNIQTDS